MTETETPLTLENEELFQALRALLRSISGAESVGEGFQAALDTMLASRFDTQPEWLVVKDQWDSVIVHLGSPSFCTELRDAGDFYQMDEMEPSAGEVRVLTYEGIVRCFDYTPQNGWDLREEREVREAELGELRHYFDGGVVLSPVAWLATPPTSFEAMNALLTRAGNLS